MGIIYKKYLKNLTKHYICYAKITKINSTKITNQTMYDIVLIFLHRLTLFFFENLHNPLKTLTKQHLRYRSLPDWLRTMYNIHHSEPPLALRYMLMHIYIILQPKSDFTLYVDSFASWLFMWIVLLVEHKWKKWFTT